MNPERLPERLIESCSTNFLGVVQSKNLTVMVRTAPHKANSSIQALLDRVVTTGYMTRLDHLQLASALLSDRRIDQDEHHQISLLFDQVQLGRIKIQG